MRREITGELLKLKTTRMAYWLGAAMLAIIALMVITNNSAVTREISKPLHEQQLYFFTVFLGRLMLLILGIRLVTDEYRHGTIVPTLLAVPNRRRVIAAKVAAAVGVGLLLMVLAEIVMVSTMAALAASEGTSLHIPAASRRALWGTALSGAVWPALGVGIGAIVRHQIPAIVGSLVWLMGIEQSLNPQLEIRRYLPGDAGMAFALVPDGWMFAGAVLVAYLAVAVGSGAALMARRDVA
jgi:ABC-type transport system involved in multi-copper enzyme maturation permease subunit